VWISWPLCLCPFIISVNKTGETYGGARLLKVPLWPNHRTIGQLVLLYHIPIDDYISNLVFENNIVEVANPDFNRDGVRILFSHGFCPFVYCAMLERMPSFFFFKGYNLSCRNIWVMTALQSHCLKDMTCCVLFPYAKSTSVNEL
jgi:hypothetical protein